MNSVNNKTSHPNSLLLRLIDKTEFPSGEKSAALSNLSVSITQKNIKSIYKYWILS